MIVEPDFSAFEQAYDAGTPQVVWTKLVADLETPVSAMLKLKKGRSNSFLLESVEDGAVRGRYSIIGVDPDILFRADGNSAQINRAALTDRTAYEPCTDGTLDALRALLSESAIDLPEGLPPMAAGVFGYLGYDMVRLMEHLPNQNPDVLGLPDCLMVRPTVIAVFDSVRDEISLVTPVRPKSGTSARVAMTRAEERLSAIVDALDTPLPHNADAQMDVAALPETQSNTQPAEYHRMVETAKEYIAAGDIFQVVPSQRFSVPFDLPPFALYRALRRTNPSPYLYFLDFEDFAVAGSSPEIMVKVEGSQVTIRPIAGTRPRGATPAEDKALEKDLLSDPKERAEHLMLLDLGRNDVGRVAKIGSVKVTASYTIERYSQVMHIVSNVIGELDPGYDAISALVAGFPAGTVSGAPKVRAMEIIDELEKEKRGLYAGCVGYFSAGGDMDTCIVLRTGVVKDGTLYVQAGGGVVADSDPEAERMESVNKAKALFRAAEEAIRFASTAKRGQ
ncbi:anthranilate synthase component I [Pyruvatibacter sp.]|uniref:anthranilate synthase component I n=1 Tax=Pyruvatibacter sp. TaxID=1981328 RepID=UPI0032EAE485